MAEFSQNLRDVYQCFGIGVCPGRRTMPSMTGIRFVPFDKLVSIKTLAAAVFVDKGSSIAELDDMADEISAFFMQKCNVKPVRFYPIKVPTEGIGVEQTLCARIEADHRRAVIGGLKHLSNILHSRPIPVQRLTPPRDYSSLVQGPRRSLAAASADSASVVTRWQQVHKLGLGQF